MAEEKKEEIAVIEITEEYMKERIYEIRGQRVILDSDLSEIYGYTTKAFNQQVKNNIEKFDEDFMFELTDDEVEDLRSNFLTANLNSKSRYNPHVFTEQGLYMLMTVLKGPLAVKQSKALIRTFKRMKDYILENRDLIGQRELLQLSMETANNRIEISKINSDMISLEKQISDVAEGLKDVVTKSELADMMNSFISDDDEKWLMFNAKFSSADEVYESIYRQAKSSIYVVDNYIGLRTLVHLKNSPTGVNIILFSDNVGNNKLHNIEYTDFCKNTVNATGHKCTFRRNIEQSQIDDMLAKLITAMTKEGKFKDAIQDKIGATVDTTDLEKQLSVLNASLHQAETIKTRLERQMDNLDVTDTHYGKKISDLQRRLDVQYD